MLGADAAADGASKGGSILAFGQSVFKRSFFKFLEHFGRQFFGGGNPAGSSLGLAAKRWAANP